MDRQHRVIVPGSTLGVFGGGQLGRMFAHAAQRLGYRVVVFTDEQNSPAGQVAQETILGDYLDPRAVRSFAEKVDVITLEFENIAIEAVARAAEVIGESLPCRSELFRLFTASLFLAGRSRLGVSRRISSSQVGVV